VDDWGVAAGTATSATSLLTIDLGVKSSATGVDRELGAKLIGGKLVVGSQTIKITLATGSQATVTTASYDSTAKEIHLGTKATVAQVASMINAALSDVSVKMKDTTGADLNFTAVVATGSTGGAHDGNVIITLTASASNKELDVTSIPELKVSAGLKLQIGDTANDYNQMKASISDMHCTSLYIDKIDISTQDGADDAINKIKTAINMVSSTRGDLGAIQNRLEHTQNNLSVMAENIQDAESTIRDTDVAEEMMSYTKNNILVQSAQAMLAQANSVPQGVLQLLQ
jgi:flagellin